MKSKKQISNKSLSVILILLSAFLTIVFAILSWMPKESLLALIIYLPLAYFIYRGKKWAVVAIMIVWTLDKFTQMAVDPSFIKSLFFWWIAFMFPFLGAFIEISDKQKALRNILKNKKLEHSNLAGIVENNNKSILLKISLFTVFLIATIFTILFYWFAIRPSQIKKKCSWVTVKAYTQEEKDEAKKYLYDNCPVDSIEDRVIFKYSKEISPECKEKRWIFMYAPVGDKNRKRSANDEEYKKCLRENGL